ncbi:MAG: hypothetical protein ACK573_08745 [Pseudanabaena sp.]
MIISLYISQTLHTLIYTLYGIVDEYQHRPVSLRSLRFLLSKGSPTFKSISKFIPDLRVPWWLILLTALKSPKI